MNLSGVKRRRSERKLMMFYSPSARHKLGNVRFESTQFLEMK